MINYFLAHLMLICGLPVLCVAAELTGTVVSKSGKPLAGVVVISRGRPLGPSGSVETDQTGSFKLLSPRNKEDGKVIFFSAPGFLPQIKIVDESTTKVHLVLEESAGHERIILSCADTPLSVKRLGFRLRAPVPRGAKVDKRRGLHGSGWEIRLGSKKKWLTLWGYFGQYAHSYPSDHSLLTSTEYTIQAWRSGHYEGVDFRGRSDDGTRWRYLALFGEEIQYERRTDEEATILDKIVDGVCVQPLPTR